MKDQFLKFHEATNNTVVYIDITEVAVIDTDDSKIPSRNVSRVYFLNSTNVPNFCVNETVEKIFTNCKVPGFIRLHNYPTNYAILVNANVISILDSDRKKDGDTNTKVYLRNSTNLSSFNVYESPDKIYQMIIDADKAENTEQTEKTNQKD